MAFSKLTITELRKVNRDIIRGRLGAPAMAPNSPLAVMSDANAGLAGQTLDYLDWLSRQFLPDTADTEWLDRQAQIWINGRKQATFATGIVSTSGVAGSIVPAGQTLSSASPAGTIQFQVTAQTTIGAGVTQIPVTATKAGISGNLDAGASMSFDTVLAGITSAVTVVTLDGGTDDENDDDLRVRVLARIRKPPMGGDADDYVAWALEVPGVTRAWCAPNEVGPGTVTVRIMCDELRATDDVLTNGFPSAGDLAAVRAHIDLKRPVCVRDFFVEAPIPVPINFTISDLVKDDASTRQNIESNVIDMLADRAAPGFARNGVLQPAQTIFAAWVSAAILDASGVESFDLEMDDAVMPHNGALAVLGTIAYE